MELKFFINYIAKFHEKCYSSAIPLFAVIEAEVEECSSEPECPEFFDPTQK